MNTDTKRVVEAIMDYRISFDGVKKAEPEEVRTHALEHLPAHIVRWEDMKNVDWALIAERFGS